MFDACSASNAGALDRSRAAVFALVFGLSMDYEVFLLSRIREDYRRTATTRSRRRGTPRAPHDHRGRPDHGLGLLGLRLAGVPSIKELGLGCAIAIALDATLVRLILVPAAMGLLGDWNWWLPSWLDRTLPHLSFEDGHPEPEPAEA